MKFRTEIEPLKMQGLISHLDKVFMIGSCFTNEIGKRMRQDLFMVLTNPFGTVYNPASIDSQLKRIATGQEFKTDELQFHNGLYHSFLAHSSLSSCNEETTLSKLNSSLNSARSFIRESAVVIVTLGTSMTYKLLTTGETVANCHKLPSACFESQMLSIEQIIDNLDSICQSIKQLAPAARIIFTVSPIRYVSYGLHENQLSKASLMLGVDGICRRYEDSCIYFPSYEIVIDDLRDYRFYDADMKHPSSIAVDYIYNIFSNSFYTKQTQERAIACRKLTRRLEHRPLTDDVNAIETFNLTTATMAERLCSAHPELAQAVASYINPTNN